MLRSCVEGLKSEDPISDDIVCKMCNCLLQEPYIACAECGKNSIKEKSIPHTFCLRCFSTGAETGTHSNTHAYIIIHDNVKVFPNSNWSAREERKLLELLIRFGFGNWADISRAIGSRTETECRDHYLQYYFDGIFQRTCNLTKFPYTPLRTPYLYRSNVIDPPRYHSDQSNFMVGYRFARNDFDTLFDSSAENIISQMQSMDQWGDGDFRDVGERLNCALVSAYNSRLRERHRRHRIMREHGLIIPTRMRGWLSKYSDALNLKKSGEKQASIGRFIAFMQLTSGIAFDRIVEGLQYENDLQKFLLKLYELRTNGVTTYQGGRVFQKLRSQRASKSRVKTGSMWEWKHLVQNGNEIVLSGTDKIIKHCLDLNQLPPKRKSTPLNIVGLPNYDKLTKDEQELCSQIRVEPDAYLTYKKLLVGENSKIGYLRLADARKLIKIDVNKTRVMYDFLLEHGFIDKPFDKQ